MIDWLRVILPNHWIRIGKKDMEWDAILNDGLDRLGVRPSTISHHTVLVGDQDVWVCNWPCSYGAPYPWSKWGVGEDKPLPTVKTAIRLRKMVANMNKSGNGLNNFHQEKERMK